MFKIKYNLKEYKVNTSKEELVSFTEPIRELKNIERYTDQERIENKKILKWLKDKLK